MKQESFDDEVRRGSLESNKDDEVPNIPRLHIPRASLSSSTTSSSKSSSTSRSREFSPPSKESAIHHEFLSESEPEGIYGAAINHHDGGNPISRTNKNNHHHRQQHKAPKPSSLHSLSSTSSSLSTNGSNQSNYSVNSLLLSVKNLENFNRKSNEGDMRAIKMTSMDDDAENPNVILKSNYYLNYFLNQETNHFPLYDHRWKMLQNIKSITSLNNIDAAEDDKTLPTYRSNQHKEADQISTTSSTTTTNFTVISLNDSDQRLRHRRSKKAICRRSHTITILIIVMTTIFVIVISIMLLLMDMRNQKMPR